MNAPVIAPLARLGEKPLAWVPHLSAEGSWTLKDKAPLLTGAGYAVGYIAAIHVADGWLNAECVTDDEDVAEQLSSRQTMLSISMDALEMDCRTITAGRIRNAVLIPRSAFPWQVKAAEAGLL